MKTSVIIPAFNCQDTITECLDTLIEQSEPADEIIVVDDGSTDQTVSLIKNFPAVKLLQQKHRGPGAARNLGAKEAIGDILVFIDADMSFDREFLDKLTLPIKTGEVRGTFFKEEYVKNWHNPWAKLWNWEYTQSHSNLRIPSSYPNEAPVFRAILASEFTKVGGFLVGGYDDDWSLSAKLGYLATNAPGAKAFHANPGSLPEIFFQAKWAAKRTYKWGELGKVLALIRANPIFSLGLGLYRSLLLKNPRYQVFKLVYDNAIMLGIVESWFKGTHEK